MSLIGRLLARKQTPSTKSRDLQKRAKSALMGLQSADSHSDPKLIIPKNPLGTGSLKQAVEALLTAGWRGGIEEGTWSPDSAHIYDAKFKLSHSMRFVPGDIAYLDEYMIVVRLSAKNYSWKKVTYERLD